MILVYAGSMQLVNWQYAISMQYVPTLQNCICIRL